MDLTKIIIDMLVSFILAGGLGYINYFILDNLGVIQGETGNTEEKRFALIFFTIIDILIFQFIKNNIFSNYVIVIFISLLVTLLFSFTVYKWMIELMYKVINFIRQKNNLGMTSNKNTKSNIFNKNRVLFAYVFDLNSDKLICHGCMGWMELLNEHLEFEIIPFAGLEPLSFEEAMKKVEKNDDMSVYINVDKNIKIVVIPEPKD